MPRPHYPSQGGPRRPAHSPAPLSDALQSHASLRPSAVTERDSQALTAEIERLRRELAQVRARPAAPDSADFHRSLWIALALCGGSLLFALIAILRRG